MEVENIEVKLVLPLDSYQKIMAYTMAVDTEITQFADITLSPTGEIRMGKVYLLKQQAGAADVEMDEEDVSSFMLECIDKGMTQLPRCWIHSHVNMQAFFSGTDVNTYTNTLDNGEWMVALVVNKRQEMKAVFQQFKPIKYTWEIPVEIEYALPEIPANIQREVDRKVKERNYMPSNTWTSQGTKKKDKHTTTSDAGSSTSHTFTFTLPKDPKEARDRIDQFGLQRKWNEEMQRWDFISPLTEALYIDTWEVVQDYGKYLEEDYER